MIAQLQARVSSSTRYLGTCRKNPCNLPGTASADTPLLLPVPDVDPLSTAFAGARVPSGWVRHWRNGVRASPFDDVSSPVQLSSRPFASSRLALFCCDYYLTTLFSGSLCGKICIYPRRDPRLHPPSFLRSPLHFLPLLASLSRFIFHARTHFTQRNTRQCHCHTATRLLVSSSSFLLLLFSPRPHLFSLLSLLPPSAQRTRSRTGLQTRQYRVCDDLLTSSLCLFLLTVTAPSLTSLTHSVCLPCQHGRNTTGDRPGLILLNLFRIFHSLYHTATPSAACLASSSPPTPAPSHSSQLPGTTNKTATSNSN